MAFNIRVLIALVALALPAIGEPAGSLQGVVVDLSQPFVPGSKILLRTLDGQGQRNTVTNGQGQFVFDKLAPGNYSVDISMPGFRTYAWKMKPMSGSSRSSSKLLILARSGSVSCTRLTNPEWPHIPVK